MQARHGRDLFVSKGQLERVMIQLEARQKQFQSEMQVRHQGCTSGTQRWPFRGG
jgi:hypothetical protein